MRFSPRQRHLVIRAMVEAEEHTSRYYCIPPFRWQQLRYDLVTRQDREWEPVPEAVLARLQRLARVGPRSRHPFDFYRIQLNDAGILEVAQRENLAKDLYPLLLFILTHEMVHLVRLSTILPDETIPCSDLEEERVARISGQVLSGALPSRLQPVLDRFRPEG